MVTEDTVLIVGAGGSMPFGYPSGRELVEQIVEKSNVYKRGSFAEPGSPLAGELINAGFDIEHILGFRKELHRSQTYSVDAFLERHPEFIEVGKVAIAAALIPRESSENLLGKNDSWYRYLANRLIDNISKKTQGQLTILTYNYDRSLEYYLYESLQAALNYSNETMQELLHWLKIIHLHGSFGALPWQSNGDNRPTRPYGYQANIGNAAKQIQIIHESIDDSPAYEEARQYLHSATRVAFLGFGYHRTNVRRLRAKGWLDAGKKGPVCGTCFGLARGEVSNCSQLLGQMILLEPLECYEFLRHHLELIS